ncbi:hypothetical protein BC941DRAFT_453080 [Chlamydoabsidia padenii]|nr:hypothetical protein BC941DRAFT_453080 [Chlamydoabsidia padenii]
MGYVFQKSSQENAAPQNSTPVPSKKNPPSSLFMPTCSSFMPTTPGSILSTSYSSSAIPSTSRPLAPVPLSRSASSTSTHSTLDQDIMKELDDDLCNLLDHIIYQQQQDDMASLSPSTPPPVSNTMSTSSSSSTNSTNNKSQPPHRFPYGHCRKLAQWHPQLPPPGEIGESVVITMTPLPKWTNERTPQTQQQTISTTKIVTCYCGPSCLCPGCLVHPTRSIFASQGLDPYAGYPNAQPYFFSSDED